MPYLSISCLIEAGIGGVNKARCHRRRENVGLLLT